MVLLINILLSNTMFTLAVVNSMQILFNVIETMVFQFQYAVYLNLKDIPFVSTCMIRQIFCVEVFFFKSDTLDLAGLKICSCIPCLTFYPHHEIRHLLFEYEGL